MMRKILVTTRVARALDHKHCVRKNAYIADVSACILQHDFGDGEVSVQLWCIVPT